MMYSTLPSMDRQFISKFSSDRYFPSHILTYGSHYFSLEHPEVFSSSREKLKDIRLSTVISNQKTFLSFTQDILWSKLLILDQVATLAKAYTLTFNHGSIEHRRLSWEWNMIRQLIFGVLAALQWNC
uniref:Dual specificity tyrosine-phosphorylation-regulated kinase 3 n=1 Tax=Schistocephalus solidus TaxID=70667 RepID=A0A0V0J1M8_SCHSO